MSRQRMFINILIAISIVGFAGCGKTERKSIVLPPPSECFENAKYSIPIFIVYYEHYTDIGVQYRVYFALWEDGEVLWGKKNDKEERGFVHSEVEIGYFRNQLSHDAVEEFLAKISRIDIGEFTGREIYHFDSPVCSLYFANNDCSLRLTIPNTSWPSYMPRGTLDEEELIIGEKWQEIMHEAENLIPKEGQRIVLSFRENSIGQWTALIQ